MCLWAGAHATIFTYPVMTSAKVPVAVKGLLISS
jgi:hypothetical protein